MTEKPGGLQIKESGFIPGRSCSLYRQFFSCRSHRLRFKVGRTPERFSRTPPFCSPTLESPLTS